NLEAHSRSWLQLTPRQTSVSMLHIGAYGLIIGITLLGVVMPFQHVWRGRVHQEQRAISALKHEQIHDVKGAVGHLIQSIARLDDTHQDGMVDASIYQQRRQAYKERLCQLIEHYKETKGAQKL